MTPTYSLNYARSGSDISTVSASPVRVSTSLLRAVTILTLSDFHEVSRAVGPGGHFRLSQHKGVSSPTRKPRRKGA